MIRQKNLSMRVLIAFITFMNMFIPLSTDLYLPAMPEMAEHFQSGSTLVGMTLTIFFFVFAVSIVIFGPISDKYGRRRVLIYTTIIYILASLTCAFAPSIYVLLVGRFFQAVGSGAIITVATALIKECFTGKLLTKILVISQALGVIAPTVAPIIGGILLTFTSWHGAFYLLTVLGIINLILAFLLTETLPPEKRYQGTIFQSMSLLMDFLKFKRFMYILMMFSMLAAPYMTYLGVSSFVYVEMFELTAQEYSYFFAVNSAAAVLGPMLYLRMKLRFDNEFILKFSFVGALISAVAVLILGEVSAVLFLLSFLIFTIVEAMVRPFSMDILLREVKENVGTASSMINFVQTFMGSVGMMFGTLPWGNFVQGLAIVMFGSIAIAIIFWWLVPKNA